MGFLVFLLGGIGRWVYKKKYVYEQRANIIFAIVNETDIRKSFYVTTGQDKKDIDTWSIGRSKLK